MALLSASASPAQAAKGTKGNGVKVVDRKEAPAGGHVNLLKTPDFRVTGECEDNGGGDVTANTFLVPRRNNLTYSAYGPGGLSPNFDIDFDKSDVLDITSSDATGTAPAIEAAEYYEFYAEGKGGRPIRGRIETTVHTLGADCGFSGVFTGTLGADPLHAAKRVKVDAGQSATVFANRDFRVVGRCEDNGGGDFTANTFLEAKRTKEMYFLTEYDQDDTDFGPADGSVDITPAVYDASGTVPDFRGLSFDNEFFAVGKSGGVLQARLGVGVHTKGADCTFSGIFTGPGSGGDLKVLNLVRLNAGKSATLFSDKNFLVTAECQDNGGGDLTADSSLDARRVDLMHYTYDGDPYFDTDFDPADGSVDITEYDATGTTPQFISEDQYTDFYGEGRGGEVLAGRIASGVHIRGADCVYAGYFAG